MAGQLSSQRRDRRRRSSADTPSDRSTGDQMGVWNPIGRTVETSEPLSGSVVSRSSMLRQRRTQSIPTLKPGLTSMAGPGARKAKLRGTSAQAPVMSRHGTAGSTAWKTGSRAPRRRYDIALNVPGAEIRLPALPQLQMGWRLVSGTITVMMLAALYLMLFTPFFVVDGVEVVGAQRLTDMDINLALGLAGETIFAIDPEDVRQQLLTGFPELASQELAIGLPNRVVLSIEERTPVLSWIQDNDEIWVDAEGVGFQPRGEVEGLLNVYAQGLPFGAELVGTDQNLLLKSELVETTLSMYSFMPEGANLVYEPTRGFGWKDERGWNVYFGQRIENIDQKLATYKVLVETLENQGIKPALISVEYLHAPYYRVEP